MSIMFFESGGYEMDTGKIMKRTVLFILISLCAFLVACHAKDAPEKAETTTSNTSSVSDILTETTSPVLAFDEKFQQYLDLLGIESDGYFEGTEEFIRSLESAQFMGISGSITYGFTENSNSTIDLMTWISNDSVPYEIFLNFTEQVTSYLDYEAALKKFDNFPVESYVWIDYSNNCMVLGWYEDSFINVRWYYGDEYVNAYDVRRYPRDESNASNKTYCEVDGCINEGHNEIVGFSGEVEYYCNKHYDDIQDMINDILNEPSYGDCDNCGRPAEYAWDEHTAYCESCFESLLNYIFNN